MHLTSTVYKANYCDIKNYCNQPLSSFHTTYCNDNNKNTPSFEYNPQFDDYLEQSDYIDQTQPADWSDLDWTADYELDRCSQPGSQGHKIGHCEHTSYTQARCSWGYERRGSLYSQNSQESTSWSPINNIADSQRRQSPYLVSYRQYEQRAAAPRRAPFQRQPAVEMEELKTPSPENAYAETSPSSRHYRPYQNSQYPQQQQPALNPNFQEFPYADRRASLSRQYSGDTDYFQLIDDLINEDRQTGDNPSVLKNELESTHSVQPEQRIPEQPSGRSAYFRHERESMKPSTSTSKTPKEEPGPSGTALVRAAALKLEPESSNAFKLLMNQQQVAGNAYNTLLGRYGLAVVW